MSSLRLIIGNKNYSSWSFRAWIAMRVKGISFEERLSRFDDDMNNGHFFEFSPAGKVPVLQDGDLVIWDSLAILESLAERFPDKGFWPHAVEPRAWARSVSNEMHAGFGFLRSECPMNMRYPATPLAVSDGVRADVRRIEKMWSACLEASGGPFLFGEFCNADAMYAPVVNRLEIYCLSSHDAVRRYTAAMKGLDAWQEWERAGREEPWVVKADEVE